MYASSAMLSAMMMYNVVYFKEVYDVICCYELRNINTFMNADNKRLKSTRLETRTKESNMYASLRVKKLFRRNESKMVRLSITWHALSINLDLYVKELNRSIYDRTRKMVNYT